jgi:hypothetical protein
MFHTRARTRLLTEWQERWNDSEMGRYFYSIALRVAIEAFSLSFFLNHIIKSVAKYITRGPKAFQDIYFMIYTNIEVIREMRSL